MTTQNLFQRGLSLALCIIFTSGGPALGADADAMLRFADSLVAEKRFDAAALEYKRALTYEPSARNPLVYRKMLDASLRADGLMALNRAQGLMTEHLPANLQCVALLYKARSLYKLENYAGASRGFGDLKTNCDDSFRDEAYYGSALSALWQKDWRGASQAFAQVSATSMYGPAAQRGSTDALTGAGLPQRSPTLAALLSVPVPGLGYAYAGQPQTAWAALLTNALFIFGTVSGARKHDTGVAVLVGLFSAGWYFGAIYGSAASARRYNHSAHEKFVSRYEFE